MPTVWKYGSLNLVESSVCPGPYRVFYRYCNCYNYPFYWHSNSQSAKHKQLIFESRGKKCRDEVITCKNAMIISLVVNRLSLRLRPTLGQSVKLSPLNDLSVKLLSLAHRTSTHLTRLFKCPSVLISRAYDCLLQILNHN